MYMLVLDLWKNKQKTSAKNTTPKHRDKIVPKPRTPIKPHNNKQINKILIKILSRHRHWDKTILGEF